MAANAFAPSNNFYAWVTATPIKLEEAALQSAQKLVLAATRPEDGQGDVRRPLDSLRFGADTYATLSVRANGNLRDIKNTSARGGKSKYTANMMIQSVSTSVNEKMQLTQTFDDDRLFFFGKNLDTLSIRAILMENDTFQWVQEWYENYAEATSGTSAANIGAEAVLRVEDVLYTGYITQFALELSATDRHTQQLQFGFTVVRRESLQPLRHEYSKLDPTYGPPTIGSVLSAQLSAAAQISTAALVDGDRSLASIVSAGVVAANAASSEQHFVSAPTREAFPAEFPNNPAGFPNDQLRDAAINTAISNRQQVGALRVGVDKLDVNNPVYALDAIGDTPTAQWLFDAIVTPKVRAQQLRAQGIEPDSPTFDRYVGILGAGLSPAFYQARAVGLGLVDLAVSVAVDTGVAFVKGALTGRDTGPDMVRNMSMRLNIDLEPEFDESLVLG